MNLKVLFIINDDEKKLLRVIDNYQLPFNSITHGIGTASKSMLDFFGLVQKEKRILLSIIPDYLEDNILHGIKNKLKLEEIGNGIAFTVPLSSSSKYIRDAFIKETDGGIMASNCEYHLVLSIVQEGFADKVMTVAKKAGANGGTLIKGRGVGGANTLKIFNMTIEPEKDIVLIVCKQEDKNKIMEAILDKCGMNKEAKGICISMPIDNVVGLDN